MKEKGRDAEVGSVGVIQSNPEQAKPAPEQNLRPSILRPSRACPPPPPFPPCDTA